MNRTAILDYVKQAVDRETSLLPKGAEFLDHGFYYKHMMASTRILVVDEDNVEKSAYEWVHTTDDHYFLCEAYCLQAMMLMPNIDDIIGFFRDNVGAAPSRTKEIDSLSSEEREELERKAILTPEHFLR